MQQTNPVIDQLGTRRWYQDDKLHRLDGPAVEYSDQEHWWYQDDKLHRLDGPAIEYSNGNGYWYRDDKLHRVNGPAVDYINGERAWFINGVQYTEDLFRLLLFVNSQVAV